MSKKQSQETAPAPTSWQDPMGWWSAASEYTVDAWQRMFLYADVRRRRGNQYLEHQAQEVPHVLNFPAELVMSGLDLPRPVNYVLVRIKPEQGQEIYPRKRPFVVVDPRAGHGPGIGGFKPDSEIGAALQAGHPCYFVGFLPEPVPGQTIEDVMRAEAEFVRKVGELHPDAEGKPTVIGNCQAGWQILMTAAVWPELFGPIIVAGAPVSYWAGDNPMRYGGGLTGGSWLTAMTSDLGAGRFDGAWLVKNFESLDPANTLWNKQHHLYANVDTEAPRYLGFEKYWGGYVYLNDVEMQYIVDNLFIGNKLTTGELMTSDGVRIDLRNIRSPIVVFCSYGDNITPPGQALGWISDLYRSKDDLIAHDQTIVYATHESIGHLGIFVSSSVGRKEHRQFAANIDVIDLLPPGLYCAEVEDKPDDASTSELDNEQYMMRIRASSLEEIHDIVKPDPESDRRFAAAARVSEMNLAWYRNTLQPWVRALSTPLSARWMQALHPLRVGYEWWSDEHPWAGTVAKVAEQVEQNRKPVSADNPFLLVQEQLSAAISQALDLFRDQRDAAQELTFEWLFGSPGLQALAGQTWQGTEAPRMHPGDTPEHRALLSSELERLYIDITKGGLPAAMVRALFYIFKVRGEADGRHFRYAWEVLQPNLDRPDLGVPDITHFRRLVRRQGLLFWYDKQAAMRAIPTLLEQVPVELIIRSKALIEELVDRGGKVSDQERASQQEVYALFDQAIKAAQAKSPEPQAEVVSNTPETVVADQTTQPVKPKSVDKTAATERAQSVVQESQTVKSATTEKPTVAAQPTAAAAKKSARKVGRPRKTTTTKKK